MARPKRPPRRPRRAYTSDEAARILKLRRHQVVDLVNRGHLRPSVSRGRRGPGGWRLFNVCDLVAIRSAHELIGLGFIGAPLRRVCRRIRQLERQEARRALLLINHVGDALHVAGQRELVKLLRHAERPFGHVVLDLRRLSKQVGRVARFR